MLHQLLLLRIAQWQRASQLKAIALLRWPISIHWLMGAKIIPVFWPNRRQLWWANLTPELLVCLSKFLACLCYVDQPPSQADLNSYSIHPQELIPRVLPQIRYTLQSVSSVFPREANLQHGVSIRECSIASIGLFLGFATNFDFCYFQRGALMLTG